LEHLEDQGSVAGVRQSHGLVDGLEWAARSEVQLVVADLYHRDERLGAWGKRVTTNGQVNANWRVDFLTAKVSIFRGLGRTKEGLGLSLGGFVGDLGRLKLLVLEVVTIQKVHEALSNLEKVTVRFKRREFNIKLQRTLSSDLSGRGADSEGVLHEFA